MANMLPTIAHDDAPISERRVFEKFKLDNGCQEWTILHSLGLAQRGTKKPYGELDFVVIVPGEGVLCLEIKGGGIECVNGEWRTTNRYGETHILKKSPFTQVQDGTMELLRTVHEKFGNNSTVGKSFFGALVIFPDTDTAPPENIGYREDEIAIAQELSGSISQLIQKKIRSQRARRGHMQTPSLAGPGEAQALVRFLRPDFELKESRATRIRRDQQSLIRLTHDQIRALRGFSENPRCLIKGPAGTGKTVLALEAYSREVTAGNRTGLFCYNKVLGGWFQRELSNQTTNGSLCGSIYEKLLFLIKEAHLYSEYQTAAQGKNSEEIFNKIIPEYAIRALIEGGVGELDYLVLDEAQDLIRPGLLDVFDVWLRGGLRKGRWSFFGDFHNQAIYSPGIKGADLLSSLEEKVGGCFTFLLNINLRNTRNIAESTSLFSGFSKLPYEVNQIDGEPVNQTFCKNKRDMSGALENQLCKLIKDGVSPKDIAILSPRKFQESVASEVSINDVEIVDVSNRSDLIPSDNKIIFSTIHSFKGMESPVVLISDILSISNDHDRSLLYIGMSRASSYLSVIFFEEARGELKEIMSKKILGKI